MPCRTENADWCSLVTVVAGEEGQEQAFQVHRKQLTQHSSFFTTALNGHWHESHEQTVPLPTMSSRYFAIYASWIYCQKIDGEDFRAWPGDDDEARWLIEDDLISHELKAEMFNTIKELLPRQRFCQMWIHADYLGDVNLQNTVIDSLDQSIETCLFPDTFNLMCARIIASAWPHTSEGPLRRWLVERPGSSLDALAIEFGDNLPSEYLRALLLEKMRAEEGVGQAGDDEDKCRYHVHNTAVPRCA